MSPERMWKRWAKGKDYYSLDRDSDVCPYCYYKALAGGADYVARNHGVIRVKERWRKQWLKWSRLADALEGCRCGKTSRVESESR